MKFLKVLINSLICGLFFSGLIALLILMLNVDIAFDFLLLGQLTLFNAVVYGLVMAILCTFTFFIVQFFSGRNFKIKLISPSFLMISFTLILILYLAILGKFQTLPGILHSGDRNSHPNAIHSPGLHHCPRISLFLWISLLQKELYLPVSILSLSRSKHDICRSFENNLSSPLDPRKSGTARSQRDHEKNHHHRHEGHELRLYHSPCQ